MPKKKCPICNQQDCICEPDYLKPEGKKRKPLDFEREEEEDEV